MSTARAKQLRSPAMISDGRFQELIINYANLTRVFIKNRSPPILHLQQLFRLQHYAGLRQQNYHSPL
nr:hypothetical transcript [Hymenolepis microstoma]